MSPARITELVSQRSAPCLLLSAAGAILKVHTSLRIDPPAPVKVEADNRLWMAVVCVCEPDSEGYSIELESDLMFRDVAATEYMAARFREPEKDAGAAGDCAAPVIQRNRQERPAQPR